MPGRPRQGAWRGKWGGTIAPQGLTQDRRLRLPHLPIFLRVTIDLDIFQCTFPNFINDTSKEKRQRGKAGSAADVFLGTLDMGRGDLLLEWPREGTSTQVCVWLISVHGHPLLGGVWSCSSLCFSPYKHVPFRQWPGQS